MIDGIFWVPCNIILWVTLSAEVLHHEETLLRKYFYTTEKYEDIMPYSTHPQMFLAMLVFISNAFLKKSNQFAFLAVQIFPPVQLLGLTTFF